MDREQAAIIGITRARWMYANAPCMLDPKTPTPEDLRLDTAHRSADGKEYAVKEGLLLNGKHTWPGYEYGCKCTHMPLIPGFEG